MITLQAGQIFVHIRFVFYTESSHAEVKVFTSQKRLKMSFQLNLNFGHKMLRFGKVTSGNLKIEKLQLL